MIHFLSSPLTEPQNVELPKSSKIPSEMAALREWTALKALSQTVSPQLNIARSSLARLFKKKRNKMNKAFALKCIFIQTSFD